MSHQLSAKRRFEVTIGLELHVQLATRTKLFCACPNDFGGAPNTRVCPVCLGLPGSYPRANAEALRLGLRLCRALGAEVARRSRWERKAYFYPDLPRGYQITQRAEPLARGGALIVEDERGLPRSIPLDELHLEDDAGRLHHELGADESARGSPESGVDYNRAGVPLLEVVTKPEVTSPEEAARALARLRAIVRALGVSAGDLERGSLRADANVSLALRPAGAERGEPAAADAPRVELKNLNSMRHLRRALRHELERQRALLEAGRRVERETRAWDDARGRTFALRGKETSAAYRYLPEPDMPPLAVSAALLRAAEAELVPLPHERFAAHRAAGFSLDDAARLADDPALDALQRDACALGAPAALAARFLLVELVPRLRERGLDARDQPLAAATLAELLRLVEEGRITDVVAKELLAPLLEPGAPPPARLVEERGLGRLGAGGALDALVEETLAAHPEQAESVRAGRHEVLGYLVGQAMRAANRRADPRALRARLAARLGLEGERR